MGSDAKARLRELNQQRQASGLTAAQWQEAALLFAEVGDRRQAEAALREAAKVASPAPTPVPTRVPPPAAAPAPTAAPPVRQVKCCHCGGHWPLPTGLRDGSSLRCGQCGQWLVVSDPSLRRAPRWWNQPIRGRWLVGGLVGALVVVLLNFHVVSGAGMLGMALVPKVHPTPSETFVSMDAITGMPFMAARTKYPLAVKALQRAKLLESDASFDARIKREIEADMEEARREVEADMARREAEMRQRLGW